MDIHVHNITLQGPRMDLEETPVSSESLSPNELGLSDPNTEKARISLEAWAWAPFEHKIHRSTNLCTRVLILIDMIYACKNTVSGILITAISIQSTPRYLLLQQLWENLEKSSYSNSLLAGHRSNLRNLNMTKTIIFARMSRQIIYAIHTY